MLNRRTCLPVLVLCLASSGCWIGGGDSEVAFRAPWYEQPAADITIEEAHLSGEFGGYDAFDMPPSHVLASTQGDLSRVQLEAGDGFWVGSEVRILGGLNSPALAPGAHLEFVGDEDAFYRFEDITAASPLHIEVGAMAGSSPNLVTTQELAHRVVVDVEEADAPHQRVLRFRADFGSPEAPQTLRGFFVYDAP